MRRVHFASNGKKSIGLAVVTRRPFGCWIMLIGIVAVASGWARRAAYPGAAVGRGSAETAGSRSVTMTRAKVGWIG